MNKDILELVKKCKNSSFNKTNYQVNIDLSTFVNSLLLYVWYDKAETADTIENDNTNFNKELAKRMTPAFQRANNKWSRNMKTKFIENLLSGVKAELMFFRLSTHEDVQILDGLQRTTAILDFFNGKIKPFGYTYHDLKENLRSFRANNIIIKIYTFSKIDEVGRFYIDMNDNITHSKKDIQKAKDWFLAEHNISY